MTSVTRKIKCIFAVCICIYNTYIPSYVVKCANLPFEFDAAVEVLTTDSFKQFQKDHTHYMTMFYAPWCGHCKTLKPIFNEIAQDLAKAGLKTKLAAVDCTVQGQLAQKFDIQGYPTLLYWSPTLGPHKYENSRHKMDIFNWLVKMEKGSVTTVTSEEATELLIPSKVKHATTHVIAYVIKGTSKDKSYRSIADMNVSDDNLVFYVVYVSKSEDTKLVIVVSSELYSLPNEELSYIYTGDENRKWILSKVYDAITFMQRRLITPEIYHTMHFTDDKTPVFVLYTQDQKQLQELATVAASMAAKYKDTIKFTFTSAKDQGILEQYTNLTNEKCYGLLFTFPSHMPMNRNVQPRKYLIRCPYSEKQLTEFFTSYDEKKLPLFYKSAEEGRKIGSFDLLTANTFSKALDPKKFFLVAYSPQWCAECIESWKTIEELWKRHYAKYPDMVLTKYLTDSNDIVDDGIYMAREFFVVAYPKGKSNARDHIVFMGPVEEEAVKEFIDQILEDPDDDEL